MSRLGTMLRFQELSYAAEIVYAESFTRLVERGCVGDEHNELSCAMARLICANPLDACANRRQVTRGSRFGAVWRRNGYENGKYLQVSPKSEKVRDLIRSLCIMHKSYTAQCAFGCSFQTELPAAKGVQTVKVQFSLGGK